MNTETPRTEQQHWAEAVAECVTDEQEALRIVGLYEDGEWQPEMLAIGRENLALKRDLTAARARVAELETANTEYLELHDHMQTINRRSQPQTHEVAANDVERARERLRALLSPSPEPKP